MGARNFVEEEYFLGEVDPRRDEVRKVGEEQVEQGRVAVLTLSGGVGTRLGCTGPKGTFELRYRGRPQSLFEMQANKVGDYVVWILLVSPKTIDGTIQHFRERIFGATSVKAVYLVEQEEVAVKGLNGEDLKDHQGNPILSPNGNGSLFKALHEKNLRILTPEKLSQESISCLALLTRKSVAYVNVVSIDNVLVKVLDPYAVGFARKYFFDIVSAGVPAQEGSKMGVFIAGRSAPFIKVCEYLDAPKGETLPSSSGKPLGNIANHIISVAFLEREDGSRLGYHEAPKKVPHSLDPDPREPNALKKELFIFDAFDHADKHGVVEYSPSAYEGLKNKEGPTDSISTCQRALDGAAN